jgi:hypothetical protein
LRNTAGELLQKGRNVKRDTSVQYYLPPDSKVFSLGVTSGNLFI